MPKKNQTLIRERGISFEDILFSVQSWNLSDDASHPNSGKHPNQRLFVVSVDDYVYLVPYMKQRKLVAVFHTVPENAILRYDDFLKREAFF